MEKNNKPWEILNKGKVPFTKGISGKFGGEKPHITFWVDESQDIRVAIWDNGDGMASFQVTRKNHLLNTSLPEDQNNQINKSLQDDDDLPF